MEKLIQEYNALHGKVIDYDTLYDLFEKMEQVDVFDNDYHKGNTENKIGKQFSDATAKLENLLMNNPDTTHFKINLSEKIDLPTGLGAPRHKGIAKEALTDCGRLKPGYKYVKGGNIEKVAAKKVKKQTKKRKTALPFIGFDYYINKSRFYNSGKQKMLELPTGKKIILKADVTEKNYKTKSKDFIKSVYKKEKDNYDQNKTPISLNFFKILVLVTKDLDLAFEFVKNVKNVPSEVSKEFRKKYDPENKLTPKTAFKKFFNEVINFPNKKLSRKELIKTAKFKVGDKVYYLNNANRKQIGKINFIAEIDTAKKQEVVYNVSGDNIPTGNIEERKLFLLDQDQSNQYDFIYEVSNTGGYRIKTYLELKEARGLKWVDRNIDLDYNIFKATEAALKKLKKDYPDNAYGDKNNLTSENLKKKDDPQLDLFKGLAGPQHEGIAKVALNSCGRLNPGYKYVKGKGIVKVKPKAKDKPTQKEHPKLKKYQKQLEDLFSKVSDLETQKDNFQKKIDKAENFSEKNDLMREKFALVKKINNLLKEQTALVNIILAVDNGGDVISVTDKKGKKHNDIADFTKVNTQEIVFNEETILTDKKPIYIPALDEKALESHGFVFDAIKTKEDTYLVSVNSFQDTKDNVFVLLTLDQLVLTSMYYTTRAKALYKQQAEDSTKRQKEYYNNLPEERRKKYFTVNSAKALYNSLPAKIKKKITLAEYEKLEWNEKEALYKPYKRYGTKRIKSKLDSKHMWASTHYMYERFVNPKATMPKPRTANPEVFEYWREFRQFLDFKINDINVQAQDYSDSRKKGLETAYGIKNTSKELFDKYGILIKRQNGSNLTVAQIENTQDAWQKILDTYRNLVPIAKDYGLKISHTGSKLVYARKALGVFNPNFNAISVSAKYGFENFTNIMAHEVAHLLDYLEGQKTGKRYASDNYESLAGQIAITFKKNMNAKSSSSYINSIKECFARALEQYFALQNYGDTATAYYIEMIGDLKQEYPYTQVDQYVGLTNFNTKVKPLIEEFLSSFKSKKNVLKSKKDAREDLPKEIDIDFRTFETFLNSLSKIKREKNETRYSVTYKNKVYDLPHDFKIKGKGTFKTEFQTGTSGKYFNSPHEFSLKHIYSSSGHYNRQVIANHRAGIDPEKTIIKGFRWIYNETKQSLGNPKPKTIEVDLSQVPDPAPKALGNPYTEMQTQPQTEALHLERSKPQSVNTQKEVVKTDAALQKENTTIDKKQKGVINSSQLMNMSFETIELTGEWADFMQDPAKNMKIGIIGRPKNGKTAGSTALANELTKHGNVLYNFTDQGLNKSTQKLWQLSGLSQKSNAFLTDTRDLDELENLCKTGNYDYVFIDMINNYIHSTGIKYHEFESRFIKKYKDISFILVFEATKTGDFKGDQGWTHILDQLINVEDFVMESKGRYGVGEYVVWKEGLQKTNPKKYKEFFEEEETNLPQNIEVSLS